MAEGIRPWITVKRKAAGSGKKTKKCKTRATCKLKINFMSASLKLKCMSKAWTI